MVLAFLRAFFTSRADLAAENAMLRQQLVVLQRSVIGPNKLISTPILGGLHHCYQRVAA
jgi:hypothetical protein